MPAELDTLLELQDEDRRIQEYRVELHSFEPELATLDDAIAECETRLAAARHAIEEAGAHRSELEAKIENLRQMQERRRQRLEWVRGAKEASTLMAELDLGRTVLAKEEAEWVRSADKLSAAETNAAEIETELRELTEGQSGRREEISGLQEEIRGRIVGAEQERAEVARRVAGPLLIKYERILKGRAPLALYPLHGGACGHCFTAVPMHRRQELQHEQAIVMCEACGVLVYDVGTTDES